ncbi:MAG: hypothetical protein LBG06_06910 [Deltaproteobacteria bacterium]|jgi:hypothetical protein|nr:hypothetical protein [Deltaproteobacteria bacterium]
MDLHITGGNLPEDGAIRPGPLSGGAAPDGTHERPEAGGLIPVSRDSLTDWPGAAGRAMDSAGPGYDWSAGGAGDRVRAQEAVQRPLDAGVAVPGRGGACRVWLGTILARLEAANGIRAAVILATGGGDGREEAFLGAGGRISSLGGAWKAMESARDMILALAWPGSPRG